MSTRFLASFCCVGALILAPAIATAQPKEAESQITVKGTVEAVDHTNRSVTILGSQGGRVTLDVPASATRFNQVKVGDPVTATYYDRVSVRLKPAGEAAVDRRVEPTTTATPGTVPGATRTWQRVATVTITGWSPTDKILTFTGPNKESFSRRLLDSTDPKILSGLKVGDRVDVTRTEAVTVSTQQSATAETLRDRLTVSVLFGPDNSFSGKMIKESTGQTLAGAPINLNETTFDDVYGRIGLLKIGVGYRETPRTESIFNFVWSSSDANEEATPIGTVGSPAVPLNVHFTEYQYWGIEGGQRLYFARTRFTPFVGGLIGINRNQDIRGTFVGVPEPPGLADQDGKFFEKSWAISLGPTAGFLIGIGPVEFQLELQFRYINGLSDVDWLVEEGLRDINEDSGRWSIPILFGARIRF